MIPTLEEDPVASGIVYGRESAAALFEEIIPLVRKHYDEINVSMGEPLDPDFDQYRLQDEYGYLRVYTARDSNLPNRELIGYAVFCLRPHLHSKTSIQAIADLLYIDPERRGFGPSFVRWCDEQLKMDGAKVVYHSVTPFCDYSPMLERMGYGAITQLYARKL
jgi:hypothetical protein